MTDSIQGTASVTSGRAVNPNSPQRTRRKGPMDFTGKKMQDLQKAHADELAAREQEIGLANAAARVAREAEVDLTEMDFAEAEEVQLQPVQVKSEKVHNVRVNCNIDQMTYGRQVFMPGDEKHPLGKDATDPFIGAIRMYSFEEGVSYTMYRDMYEYLDDKGYIWH